MNRFSKFLLRLLGCPPQELPEPFSGRIDDVTYDVQPLDKGMVSISMYLSRDRMVIQPTCYRKNEGYVCSGTHIEWSIDALVRKHVRSVDVGFSGEKVEAIFPGEFVRVDKQFADEVACYLLYLRREALGEQAPYEPRRSWSKEAEGSLELDGQTVTFEFSSCLVDTDEEGGTLGNLDVMVRTTPSVPIDKLDNLKLEVPGCDELLHVFAHGEIEGGFELSFSLTGMSGLDGDRDRQWRGQVAETLQEVSIVWGATRETRLATVPCVRASENA